MPLVRCTGSSTGKVSLETAADPPPPTYLSELGDGGRPTTYLV